MTEKFSEEGAQTQKANLCFVTELDLDRESFWGGLVDDRKMIECLKEFGKVEVIYLQKGRYKSAWLALLVFIWKILRSLAKPHQVYVSRGLVNTSVLLLFRTVFRRKIVHKTPVPFASNDLKYLKYNRFESLLRYFVFRFLERVAMPKVDAIIVPSPNYSEELVKNGIEESRVHVIPYYVEEEFFEQPIKYDVNDAFAFCYVGAFHHYHDLLPLIDAFEIVTRTNPNVKLVMVGDGVSRREVEKRVRERQLGNKIEFLGRYPHYSIPSLLSKMDSFVHFARMTSMSTSLLEATAAGKPVITLRKKGDQSLTRYFKHEKEIYMVDILSPAEIAEALNRLCTDSKLRNSIAEGARRVALRQFNKEATIRQLQKLFDEMHARE